MRNVVGGVMCTGGRWMCEWCSIGLGREDIVGRCGWGEQVEMS